MKHSEYGYVDTIHAIQKYGVLLLAWTDARMVGDPNFYLYAFREYYIMCIPRLSYIEYKHKDHRTFVFLTPSKLYAELFLK